MQRTRTILRTSLICTLILGLGMTGFCARPVVAIAHHACGDAATSETHVRTCCCPNCNGRCSGICCQQQGPKPAPAPMPSRNDDGKHNPVLVIVQIGSLAAGTLVAGCRHVDASSFDGSQAVVSLQSQHVRIQT